MLPMLEAIASVNDDKQEIVDTANVVDAADSVDGVDAVVVGDDSELSTTGVDVVVAGKAEADVQQTTKTDDNNESNALYFEDKAALGEKVGYDYLRYFIAFVF